MVGVSRYVTDVSLVQNLSGTDGVAFSGSDRVDGSCRSMQLSNARHYTSDTRKHAMLLIIASMSCIGHLTVLTYCPILSTEQP